MVETWPKSLTTSSNHEFSIKCTARAEVDEQPLPLDIEWSRTIIYSQSGLNSTTKIASPEGDTQSFIMTAENMTVITIIYRCTARTQNLTSFSDTTVFVSSKFIYYLSMISPKNVPIITDPIMSIDTDVGYCTSPTTTFISTLTVSTSAQFCEATIASTATSAAAGVTITPSAVTSISDASLTAVAHPTTVAFNAATVTITPTTLMPLPLLLAINHQ